MAAADGARGTRRSGSKAPTASDGLRLGDPAVLLLCTTGGLLFVGLVMILSASSVSSFATYGSSFLFFKKQLVWAALGVAGLLVFARVDYRRLRGFGYPSLAAAVVLLAAVLVPGVGIVAGGSARWLAVGPVTFQPSEFAKLALVLFSADVFSRKRQEALGDLTHTVVPLVPALGVLAVLVMLQPDLGTTLVLGLIAVGMLFVAGAPMRYLISLAGLGACVAAAWAFSADYRRARIFAFFDPWADPLNTGYQAIQSLIALGSGGWFGVGLGASRQKWLYVPNAHTDFIYAILGEEMGLLGTLVVLGMFALLAYLGVLTARRAPDRFGSLVAAGITIWMALQALINVGAVTSALPITGIPLPLVSFGGSSLVVSLVAMGILVNIARASDGGARDPARSRRPPAARTSRHGGRDRTTTNRGRVRAGRPVARRA